MHQNHYITSGKRTAVPSMPVSLLSPSNRSNSPARWRCHWGFCSWGCRSRPGSTASSTWSPSHWDTRTRRRWFWTCRGCSSARLCRRRSIWACIASCWCSLRWWSSTADLLCRCSGISYPAGEGREQNGFESILTSKWKINWGGLGDYLDVIGDVDLAGPQVAKARLFDQLTPLVGIGHPERQATAAALWAGAPWACLADAVLVPAPGLSWSSWTNEWRALLLESSAQLEQN